jgi:hypothetical protein
LHLYWFLDVRITICIGSNIHTTVYTSDLGDSYGDEQIVISKFVKIRREMIQYRGRQRYVGKKTERDRDTQKIKDARATWAPAGG